MNCDNVIKLAAATAALALMPTALAQTDSTKVQVGANLSGIHYWSRETPWEDAFKNFQPFTTLEGNAGYDDNGFPTWVNGTVRSIWDRPHRGTDRQYTMLYDGRADIDLRGVEILSESRGRIAFQFTGDDSDPRDYDRVLFEIDSVNGGDPIRNIRVVPTRREHAYRDGMPSNPWNRTFLNDLNTFDGSVRFMDWGQTNSSEVRTWNDRTTPSYSVQSANRNNPREAHGVALEHQIQLANDTGKNPWFNIPHEADDNYIRQMATMIRDELDPNLRARIEYSNEMWNWTFGQSRYGAAEGQKLWSEMSEGEALFNYIGHRSNQAFDIIGDVFTEADDNGMDRVQRIVGTQKGNTWVTEKILNRTGGGENIDSIALAPYWGKVVRRQSDADDRAWVANFKSQSWNERERDSWSLMYETLERIHKHKAEIAQHNPDVTLVGYEGGQHYVPGGDWNRDDELVDLMHELNRRPAMREMYRAYLQEWERAGGGEFVLFNATEGYGNYGSWGLREYMGQDPQTAPKLQGVIDYLHGGRVADEPQTQFVTTSFVSNDWQASGNVQAVEGDLLRTQGRVVLTGEFDTTNMQDIVLSLTARQSGGQFEGMGRGGDDWLKVFVDYGDGTGWQLVIIDDAEWTGEFDAASFDNSEFNIVSDHGNTGNTTLTAADWLMLSDLAADNDSLKLMVELNTTQPSEWYDLASLSLGGTAIPEPTTGLAVGALGLGLLRRDRRPVRGK
jgi:hypothetical protein